MTVPNIENAMRNVIRHPPPRKRAKLAADQIEVGQSDSALPRDVRPRDVRPRPVKSGNVKSRDAEPHTAKTGAWVGGSNAGCVRRIADATTSPASGTPPELWPIRLLSACFV